MLSIDHLPTKILEEILDRCTWSTFGAFAQTCRQYRDITSNYLQALAQDLCPANAQRGMRAIKRLVSISPRYADIVQKITTIIQRGFSEIEVASRVWSVEQAIALKGSWWHTFSDTKLVIASKIGTFPGYSALRYASGRLRDDPDLVWKVVHNDVCSHRLQMYRFYEYDLQFVSQRWRDNLAVMQQAVRRCGCKLAFASPRLQDYRPLVQEAITSYAEAIQYASAALKRDPALAQLALDGAPRSIYFIDPQLLQNETLMVPFIRQHPQFARHLHISNKQIALAAVETDPMVLGVLASPLRHDLDILKTALTKNGLALRCIMPSVQKEHPELVWMALRQNGLALAHVRLFVTQEMRMAAVRSNGLAIQCMPRPFTARIALAASEQNSAVLCYLPQPLRSSIEETLKLSRYLDDTFESAAKRNHAI